MDSVCILTVYNSENCGSYLQAFALKTTLERLGFRVLFIKRPTGGTSHSAKTMVKKCLRKMMRLDFHQAYRIIYRYMAFQRAQKVFKTTLAPLGAKCMIVGSDTLWNFDKAYFSANTDRYLASKWNHPGKISFAVSAGNTKLSRFREIPGVADALNAFRLISVRDRHTQGIVCDLTGERPPIVCDPAFLLTREEYEPFMEKHNGKKYLVVYYAGVLGEAERKWLTDYAKKQGLEIVSIGGYDDKPWCKKVDSIPSRFLTYMKNAEFVFTNTFHGTAFAIIFRRNFAAYVTEKVKVTELLAKCGLGDRQCGTLDALANVASTKIDYDAAQEIVDAFRENSIQFLKRALKE